MYMYTYKLPKSGQKEVNETSLLTISSETIILIFMSL